MANESNLYGASDSNHASVESVMIFYKNSIRVMVIIMIIITPIAFAGIFVSEVEQTVVYVLMLIIPALLSVREGIENLINKSKE